MYGNKRLPNVSVSETYRSTDSIWRGSPDSTWFKIVKVNGDNEEASSIREGTIMKEVLSDGSYTPITEADINMTLPGDKFGIMADSTAQTGTTTTDDGTEKNPSSVLIGTRGEVDKARLYVEEKKFTELEEAQQLKLNKALELWGFQLETVQQS